MRSADECSVRICSRQHGCISRIQALECGLSPNAISRRCRSGRWEGVLPRVYALRGSPTTWERRFFAAVLWGGDASALSVRSAAWLWGFPDSAPATVEISYQGNKRSRPGVIVHRVDLRPEDVTRVDGLPVTTPARTLLDLAEVAGAAAFDAAFHYCLHRRLTTVAAVQATAQRRGAGRPGAATVREALAAYSGGRAAGSPLETRVDRVLRKSALPPYRRQHEVCVGGRRRYLDFAWPEHRVALEVDGYRWHSSRGAWESDRARARELRLAGWTIVGATHDDVVSGGDTFVTELRALLAQ